MPSSTPDADALTALVDAARAGADLAPLLAGKGAGLVNR